MNLKLPVAVNAMKLAKKEPNTPEGDAISSVAVAVSSIMTIIILALAALLSAWISLSIQTFQLFKFSQWFLLLLTFLLSLLFLFFLLFRFF